MAKASFSPERKKQLLLVIAALVLVRFVAVPIMDAQQERRQGLAMVTQQLERAIRLVEQPGANQSLAELQQQRAELESTFIAHGSTGEFRLAAQQRIESVLQANNVQVNLFDWLSNEAVIEDYLMRHQANLVIEGASLNLIQAQLSLLESIQGLSIKEYVYFQPRQTSRGPGAQNARMTLLVEMSGVQA